MDSVKIIENGFVVTCDGADRAGVMAILVKGDRIAELNPVAAGLRARYPNAEVIDASDKIILPGFVDAHYHGESFALRMWTDRIPLARWNRVAEIRLAFSYLQRTASKEELIPMYRAAYFSALKAGVTTISEFGFDHLDVPFAAAREALRRSDLRGFVGIHNSEQMDHAKADSASGPLSSLVLPAEEDLTLYGLQTTLRLAGEFKVPILSHLGETREGHEAIRRNFNRSIVRILDEFRIFHYPVQMTHGGLMSEEDLDVLAAAGIPVIVNPASLPAKQTEPPPVGALLDRGIPLALGSDWGLPDPFENMRQVRRMPGAEKLTSQHILRLHTLNSARALGLHHEIGSIEPGKKSDMTFVDVSAPAHVLSLASGDPERVVGSMLRDCTRASVSDVMINGDFFLRKGQVMTYAEEDLKREYREAMQGLLKAVKGKSQGPAESTLAPILPLHQEDVSKPEVEDGSFEEGFRIIGTTGSFPRSTEARPGEQSRRADELPKTVRRTFGEDDF
ncbi:MAG: 5-methylthioadenosine/S-adenosylhomocysteine deaminase [Bacteroidia bacterium]|nr:MAG: 5-methylthioadenosine/S-adenosylhomocysteine deaminase [Bacteroidia bacterium]